MTASTTPTRRFPMLQCRGNRDKPVIINFWVPWCDPCRAIGLIFEKLSQDPPASAIAR
ncbi:hypothetical protein BDM02DRAFT_2686652 [Thelephora ganbajun]|uniref:Uncharacterized protein n=1 Tax=Thelephora ganbajun TaxID=370292 RepID=A0ACB6ZD28_THEGA|nr:hypothetical protein BDM02DRAFT_2686652 [Thelephora ganbajun]